MSIVHLISLQGKNALVVRSLMTYEQIDCLTYQPRKI
jgi:hypothetical protein